MTKHVDFQWKVPVPPELLQGAVFDRWSEEDNDLELEAEFRVDESGFYIYWKSEGRDGDVLDLSQVSLCKCLKYLKHKSNMKRYRKLKWLHAFKYSTSI